jgi:hypothetical protein
LGHEIAGLQKCKTTHGFDTRKQLSNFLLAPKGPGFGRLAISSLKKTWRMMKENSYFMFEDKK